MKEKQYKLTRHFVETGALLQKARENANFTQKEISEHLEYSAAQFISNFERGISSPPTAKLHKLLKMLRISIDEFMKVYAKEEIARQRHDIMAAARKK